MLTVKRMNFYDQDPVKVLTHHTNNHSNPTGDPGVLRMSIDSCSLISNGQARNPLAAQAIVTFAKRRGDPGMLREPVWLNTVLEFVFQEHQVKFEQYQYMYPCYQVTACSPAKYSVISRVLEMLPKFKTIRVQRVKSTCGAPMIVIFLKRLCNCDRGCAHVYVAKHACVHDPCNRICVQTFFGAVIMQHTLQICFQTPHLIHRGFVARL